MQQRQVRSGLSGCPQLLCVSRTGGRPLASQRPTMPAWTAAPDSGRSPCRSADIRNARADFGRGSGEDLKVDKSAHALGEDIGGDVQMLPELIESPVRRRIRESTMSVTGGSIHSPCAA